MWSPILLAIIVAILMAATFGCDRREDQRTSNTRDQSRDRTATAPIDNRADESFFTGAAKANLAEVEFGTVAASKGTDPEVKKFGQQMVDDHSQANASLTDLAQRKGVTLPTSIDEDDREEAAKLANLSGTDFDRHYAALMVKKHEKSVARYEKATKDAKDADVRAFAEKTLMTIQHHQKMARDLSEKVGPPTAD